jgi:tRNA nucleotidyltransferase/poly(A) polymerase
MKLRELLNQLNEVHKNIGTSAPMICGGVARDKFLNNLEKISDLDITTGDKTIDYLSEEFVKSLRKQFPVNKKVMPDGHSTIYIGNLKIDFSSNFIAQGVEKYIQNKNLIPTNMLKEMFSRDFTCNALLMSMDLKQIFDPTGSGFADCKNKMIKTCLPPDITLTLNKNRVVRAIYLAAKLDFNIDKSIIDYVRQNPQSINIGTSKSLNEKIEEAFKWDGDKASYLIKQMNLWKFIPITNSAYPYYMKENK